MYSFFLTYFDINIPYTAPDKEEARRIASEIKKILSQDDKDKSDTSEIDSMFTVPPVIIEPPKKL